jgi:hypothetical protein
MRLHALTPPGVERRCRRNPAGPTRVNVYLFILFICPSTPRGARWREAPPCDPVYPAVLAQCATRHDLSGASASTNGTNEERSMLAKAEAISRIASFVNSVSQQSVLPHFKSQL